MKKDKLDTKYSINMKDFICNYLNDNSLIKINKLSHKDLKMFDNPYVISLPFEYANSNIELIYQGLIILVRDSFNNLAPYINPNKLRKLYLLCTTYNDEIIKYELKELSNVVDILLDNGRENNVIELGGKEYVKEYKRR